MTERDAHCPNMIAEQVSDPRNNTRLLRSPRNNTSPANHASLGMVARQRCAKRARPENEPEREGGWNSRSEATRAARSEQLGGAQDLQKGLAMVTFASSDRTRRWTCSVRPARARQTTRTGSTRDADQSINSTQPNAAATAAESRSD